MQRRNGTAANHLTARLRASHFAHMTRKGRFVPRNGLFDIWPNQAIGLSRRNRSIRIIDNAGSPDSPRVVLASQYDPAGNRESLAATLYNGSTAEPDFINNYSYDALSRLTVMQQQRQNQPGANAVAAKEIDYAYNGLGEVTSRADFNFIGVGPRQDMATGKVTYDPTTGLLTGLDYTSHGGATAIDNFSWTYDTLARVKTFSSIDGTATYGYDSRSEVASAGYTTNAGGHQPANESFSFDANGNRPVASGGTIVNNEVSDDGTFKYTFDADGNRLTRTRDSAAAANDYQVSYSCDYRNRLVEVRDFNNSGALTEQIDYTYDVFDHLIQRVDDIVGGSTTTTQYIWDQLSSAADSVGNALRGVPQSDGGIALTFTNGALSARNLNGPNTSAADQYFTTLAEEHVTSLVSPGTLTFDLPDNLGTLRDVADANGNPADHLVYTVFGQLAYESAPTVSHIAGYAGGLYDPSTQLVYFIHRWYDPAATVWISADPLGFAAGDTNLTRYVGNGTPNRSDSAGLAAADSDGDYGADDGTAPLKKGDIRVTVYVRQPVPGERNTVVGGFVDFGHCFVSVEGYDANGKLRRATRGFYPTAPLDSLNRKPQKGIVQSDAAALTEKKYDVSYTKTSHDAENPFIPSYGKMVDYMDEYDDDEQKQPYDLDDRSCAHFVLDVLKHAGNKRFPAAFGKVKHEGKTILTPSALGEDLKQYGGRSKQ